MLSILQSRALIAIYAMALVSMWITAHGSGAKHVHN